MKKAAAPAPLPDDITIWAAEIDREWWDGRHTGASMAEMAIRCRRAGLEAALHVVGGPSFITKKKIKDLIAEADRAVKPT